MAMQSAVLLANENAQLRAANSKQKKKMDARRSYIAIGGALTAAEAAEAIQQSEGGRNEQGGVDEAGPSEPKRRAPSKCSICKSENHTARTCALR